MSPELLNAHEVADRLGAKYRDVLEWTREGVIPAVKIGGAYYYWLPRVIEGLRSRAGSQVSSEPEPIGA
jgi:excisionase family DNA binding protein